MSKSESISAKAAIPEANRAFAEAFARQEAAGATALYTDDGEILPPNTETIRGTSAIQAFWERLMAMGVKIAALESVEIEATGPFACEVGRYTLRGAEAQVLDRGKYIVIWENEHGQWKLHRDIWKSSLAGDKAG